MGQQASAPMPGHRVAYSVAIVVTTLTALCAAITLAGGDALGISEYAVAWVGVLGSVLGVLNGFLPSVQRFPTEGTSDGD
jgi:hypothetical protein